MKSTINDEERESFINKLVWQKMAGSHLSMTLP
jgi:hypothetical protein